MICKKKKIIDKTNKIVLIFSVFAILNNTAERLYRIIIALKTNNSFTRYETL